MKRLLPEFQYDSLHFNLLAEADLSETLRWRNHYRIWFNQSQIITLDDHQSWFHHYQKKANDYVFLISDEKNQKIGQAAIYNINWELKNGEFGRFLVNPDHSGKQYMKKASLAMIELNKTLFGLKTLFLHVKHHNEKAIHIYKSAGFHFSQQDTINNLIMTYQEG